MYSLSSYGPPRRWPGRDSTGSYSTRDAHPGVERRPMRPLGTSWIFWSARAMLVYAVVGTLGCDGIVLSGSTNQTHERPVPPEGELIGTPLDESPPAPTTRLPRLTHLQWANTVRDLFGLHDAASHTEPFRSDPVLGGALFSNQSASYEVDELLWGSYQRAASDVARRVTEDEAISSRILPPVTHDAEARARTFVETFGRRAHRRPLSLEEVDEYMAVFTAGRALNGDVEPFHAGIRLVIEAMLQSPSFVYRIESSSEPVGDAIPLGPYEIAQRLSYALWDSMPDEELFEAAAAGALDGPEDVAAQARRMLDDPRAADVLQSFHEQLFDVRKFSSIYPSEARFPDVPPNLGEHALEESKLFIRKTVVEEPGNYADLLLSTTSYVNGSLAAIYGLSGEYGDAFVPTALERSERPGLFTRIGFLGSHATSVDPDPIHRGIFLAERVACVRVSAPPDDIPPLPAAGGRTNRETVEELTETPGTVCAACHATIINPYGFPFEGYDAVGAIRTIDNGFPVVTHASPLIGGASTPVADAVDMLEKLAASGEVHECYSRHWLEFVYGRRSVQTDRALVTKLGARSLEGSPVRELLVGLVTAQAFLNRSVEELP